MYVFLADLTAGLHVAFVLAVLLGLVVTLAGKALGWQWVSNRWFRSLHLAMIVGVVIRAAVWSECPLTWWERDLRQLGGQMNYEGSVVGKFLHDLIHPSLPGWVFPLVYVAFALLIAAAFWFVPVRWRAAEAGRSEQGDPALLAPAGEGLAPEESLASANGTSQGA